MLKEIILALQSYADAHRFIRANRLWKWIIIPGLIYLLMFAAGGYLFWKSGNYFVQEILARTGLQSWLDSKQDEWLNLFLLVINTIVWIFLLLFYFSIFKYGFLIIGSPLFAYLSERTEAQLAGRVFRFNFKELLADIGRTMKIALRNLLWQVVYLIFIFLLTFIPVIGWATPVLTILMECYYFGFSMLDFTCERNRMTAAQSIYFIGHHKGLAIGNGIGFFLLHLIPVIGWLVAPTYAVIAATMSLLKYRQKNEALTYL